MEPLLNSRSKEKISVYLNVAKAIARLSRCKRNQVGAIIVKNDNIVAFGYNGPPAGFCNDCEDENGVTFQEVIHAETNAILKAGKYAKGADLYITLGPCVECCKLIKQAGINHVYFIDTYRDTSGLEKLKINFTQVNP